MKWDEAFNIHTTLAKHSNRSMLNHKMTIHVFLTLPAIFSGFRSCWKLRNLKISEFSYCPNSRIGQLGGEWMLSLINVAQILYQPSEIFTRHWDKSIAHFPAGSIQSVSLGVEKLKLLVWLSYYQFLKWNTLELVIVNKFKLQSREWCIILLATFVKICTRLISENTGIEHHSVLFNLN